MSGDQIYTSWTDAMLAGDFEAAWRFSDLELRKNAGRSCVHLPRHLQYIWNGTSLSGRRVLIRCYHGLGDVIHFARYLPFVERVASRVDVWIRPELIPLMQTMPTSCRFHPLSDGSPPVDYDVDVELMELPFIFRTTLKTIPADVPYLCVDPSPRQDNRLAVGLVWQGGDWDLRRNIPFDQIAPILTIPGIAFCILQRGPALCSVSGCTGLLPGSDDLFTAARIIKSLDLVITIDSMPAHLAGALGVPVWTLLNTHADWRWMRDRSDCPWYPAMRLFRQPFPGDWNTVIGHVIAELLSLRDSAVCRKSV